MKKQEVKRNYDMADTVLTGKCIETKSYMERDATEFGGFNVTPTDTSAFGVLTDDFQEIETDEELSGVLIIATENRDAKAEEVKVAVRAIMTRAQNKFGVHSGRYRKFGTQGMDEMGDLALLACGRRVRRVANTYIGLLAAVGLTPAMLTALNTLNDELEDAIHDQRDAIADRDIATEDRIEHANALYKLLVDYCNIGKNIWVTSDEAKYNDYVIYDTPTGAPAPPPPVV